MSMLLNRKYGSRLECLYYILNSCYKKFGTTKYFSLNDLKFDENDINNVHCFCKQVKIILGRKCCPYLNNPLDSSKCYATQSIVSDSTKSKAVSDIGGSLEALGFISRKEKNFIITQNGEKWIKSQYGTKEWEDVARRGVLSYGVVIGFLSKLRLLPNKFTYSGIYLSYPHTIEKVDYQGSIIEISTDSQRDSNTRTLSKIIGWCVTVGLIEPCGVKVKDSLFAHIKYQDFLNAGELTVRNFVKTSLCDNLFKEKLYVSNPLAYSRLHKAVKSLRENGGDDLRNATLQYNSNILNRRFVFIYVLNYCSKKDVPFYFDVFMKAMKKYSACFFSKGNDENDIMSTECEIADIAGIPFYIKDNLFIPLTTINENILLEDAPTDAIKIANLVIQEMGI